MGSGADEGMGGCVAASSGVLEFAGWRNAGSGGEGAWSVERHIALYISVSVTEFTIAAHYS
jgi:hypothetical protein